MKMKRLIVILLLIMVFLLGCQPANTHLADNNGSTPAMEHSPSSPHTTAPTTALPTQTPEAAQPTTPPTTQPTTQPNAQPTTPADEPLPFAYEWTDKFEGWTNLKGEATRLPSFGWYTLIVITSPQEAAAYGCPENSEYMNSDFYKNRALIFVLFEEPVLEVEHAITNLAEDGNGGYRLEIDRFFHEFGSDAMSYESFMITVNRSLLKDTNIVVNITDKQVDFPIGE